MATFSTIVELLHEWNIVTVAIRIISSMICGGVIGWERGRANQPAGMRTYMLVCLGAAVVMITGEYVYNEYGAGDPSRLGAQVISGIGFLGAGSIVISGQSKIRGLTTAAGLWVSACIGLVVGIGFIECGVLATATVYIIIARLKHLEERMMRKTMWMEVIVKLDNVDSLADFYDAACGLGLKVGTVQVYNKKHNIKSAVISIQNTMARDKEEIMKELTGVSGINSVRFIS